MALRIRLWFPVDSTWHAATSSAGVSAVLAATGTVVLPTWILIGLLSCVHCITALAVVEDRSMLTALAGCEEEPAELSGQAVPPVGAWVQVSPSIALACCPSDKQESGGAVCANTSCCVPEKANIAMVTTATRRLGIFNIVWPPRPN